MEATNGLVLAGAPKLPDGYFYRVDLDGEGDWRVQIRKSYGWGFSRAVWWDGTSDRKPSISKLASVAERAYNGWQEGLRMYDEHRSLKGDYK